MSSATAGNKVFAPAIFFIAFREALEASLVIGTLAGMLERVVDVRSRQGGSADKQGVLLVRKLRKYIFLGALCGLLVAFAIGAAFLAVFYTQTTDLYGRSEELWEGISCLIAVCLITPMSLAILRADRSRAKWRKKLAKAFAGLQQEQQDIKALVHHRHSTQQDHQNNDAQHTSATANDDEQQNGQDIQPAANASAVERHSGEIVKRSSQSISDDVKDGRDAALQTPGEEANATHVLESSTHAQQPKKEQQQQQGTMAALWTMFKRPFSGESKSATAIFVIPFVTTLREGLEGVVFIGGVSLGLPASSIPLPAIVGLFVGLLCGYVVFKAGSFSKVRIFLVFSTSFLLVIAAGMFSRSVYYFQFYKYVQMVGDAAAESGSDAGSYDARNYVWHLNCCNPEDKTNGGSGWAILNSIVGWNNTATTGSILSYIFFWLAVITYLIGSTVYDNKRKRNAAAKKQEAAQTSTNSQEDIKV